MFVKLGKINGFFRERGRSGVWNYFGELFYKESKAGEMCSVDNQCHYCSLCLKKQQIPNGQVSQIQSYTLSTATSTLNDHLRAAHDVKLLSNLKVFANL